MLKTIFRKSLLIIDEGGPYEGYTGDKKWNEFEAPAFTDPVARQILDEAYGISWYFDDSIDSFIVHQEGDDLGDPPLRFQGFFAMADDGPEWLYPIGAYFWTWREVEPENTG